MAKAAKVRIEFGAAVASTRARGAPEEETTILLVYAVLVDGVYQGIFSSQATQGRGATLDDRLFELPRPEGYEGPWDSARFAVGTGSFFRQSFAQRQKLAAELPPGEPLADTVVTDRWAFDLAAAQ